MPINETIDFTFSGTFFFVIPSIASTNKCQPSKPGKGKRLITAKLTLIIAQSSINLPNPRFFKTFEETTPRPTIPLTLETPSGVNNEPKPLIIAIEPSPKSTKD